MESGRLNKQFKLILFLRGKVTVPACSKIGKPIDHHIIFLCFKCVSFHGKLRYLLIYGGYTAEQVAINSFQVFDTVTSSWLACEANLVPVTIANCKSLSLTPTVSYIFGGQDIHDRPSNLLYEVTLNVSEEELIEMGEQASTRTNIKCKIHVKIIPKTQSTWPSPRTNHSMAACPEQRYFVIAGGEYDLQPDQTILLSDVWCFDRLQSKWTEVCLSKNFPPRSGMTLASFGTRLYMFGGIVQSSPVTTSDEMWVLAEGLQVTQCLKCRKVMRKNWKMSIDAKTSQQQIPNEKFLNLLPRPTQRKVRINFNTICYVAQRIGNVQDAIGLVIDGLVAIRRASWVQAQLQQLKNASIQTYLSKRTQDLVKKQAKYPIVIEEMLLLNPHQEAQQFLLSKQKSYQKDCLSVNNSALSISMPMKNASESILQSYICTLRPTFPFSSEDSNLLNYGAYTIKNGLAALTLIMKKAQKEKETSTLSGNNSKIFPKEKTNAPQLRQEPFFILAIQNGTSIKYITHEGQNIVHGEGFLKRPPAKEPLKQEVNSLFQCIPQYIAHLPEPEQQNQILHIIAFPCPTAQSLKDLYFFNSSCRQSCLAAAEIGEIQVSSRLLAEQQQHSTANKQNEEEDATFIHMNVKSKSQKIQRLDFIRQIKPFNRFLDVKIDNLVCQLAWQISLAESQEQDSNKEVPVTLYRDHFRMKSYNLPFNCNQIVRVWISVQRGWRACQHAHRTLRIAQLCLYALQAELLRRSNLDSVYIESKIKRKANI